MTTQIEAMKNALDALGTCEDMLPNYHQWLSDAKHELRAAIEAAEKVGPDGYVEIEIYDGIRGRADAIREWNKRTMP